MSTFVKDPITGKDKAIIADDGIYSTITGRKIAYVENGEIISVFTGKPISVVATDSNGESVDLTNLVANNIKTGVTINGVTGNFTSDANAVSADIISGKTAYVKGSLVTGTMQNISLYQDGYLTVACNGGYVDGYQYLTLTDSNLIADNIKKDVTIFGVSGSIDLSNLLPENIKSGVTINGITGTYEGGGGSEGGTSNADYIVSGAVSVPEVNGEYVEDGTLNDRPKYVNTSNSNAIIRFDAMVGWSVFYMGQPKYTTMDTTSATPPVSATWKYGSETVTVTQG